MSQKVNKNILFEKNLTEKFFSKNIFIIQETQKEIELIIFEESFFCTEIYFSLFGQKTE